ncbi:hypothetical protein Rsub_07048 [Raphidocelis subcapitata]|uniref:Uncharacterized protein n=1 Tax=Raphidocelis subcapitata TaxID=307507 RepID=A0A2V0P3S3_9CHLO|nr:hypothetical protein Rsub_07048 [Raphidocelis subcapitata]|eukprot:GBF94514.1 hypothetical protein Rsub_07048 [Raphidocelis subcapitata]
MASRQGGAGPGRAGGAPLTGPEAQRRIAALLIAQAQQLEERAATDGATAFCGRPVQRERLNERFLANTLRGVASTNRRAQERQMWAAWEKEAPAAAAGAARQGAGGREGARPSSGGGPRPGDADGGSDGSEGAARDEEFLAWLAASRRVRGRGEIGPRSGQETGPHLPPPDGERGDGGGDGGGGGGEEGGRHALGPARPGWLPLGGGGASSSGRSAEGGGGGGLSSGLSSGSAEKARKRRKRSRSRSRSRERKKSSSHKSKKSSKKHKKRRRGDG